MRSWSLQRARLQAIPCQVKTLFFFMFKAYNMSIGCGVKLSISHRVFKGTDIIYPLDLVFSCPYLTVFLKRLMYAIWPG